MTSSVSNRCSPFCRPSWSLFALGPWDSAFVSFASLVLTLCVTSMTRYLNRRYIHNRPATVSIDRRPFTVSLKRPSQSYIALLILFRFSLFHIRSLCILRALFLLSHTVVLLAFDPGVDTLRPFACRVPSRLDQSPCST